MAPLPSTAAVTAGASVLKHIAACILKHIAACSGVNPQWSLALTSAPASKAERMAAKHSARLGTCTAASRSVCSSGVSRGCPSVDWSRAWLLHNAGLGAGAAERHLCGRLSPVQPLLLQPWSPRGPGRPHIYPGRHLCLPISYG